MVVKNILNHALMLKERKELMAKVAEGTRLTKEDKELAGKIAEEIGSSLSALTEMEVEEVEVVEEEEKSDD
jgi:hypothetical protein